MYEFLCAHKFSKIKKKNLSQFLNKCQPGFQTPRKEGGSDDLPRKLLG